MMSTPQTPKTLKNENGFSLMGSMILLMVLAFICASVLEVSSADTSTGLNNYHKTKAFFVAHAGLEWSKHQIKSGAAPVSGARGMNKFDPNQGSFTVALNATTKTVTATGRVSNAKSVQSLTIQHKDCFSVSDSYDINFGSGDVATGPYGAIYAIKMTNICNAALGSILLDKIRITNLATTQSIEQIVYQGSDVYNRNGRDYRTTPTSFASRTGTAVSNAFVNPTNMTLSNGLERTIDNLYIKALTAPARGTTFNVEFIFIDGSIFEKVFTY